MHTRNFIRCTCLHQNTICFTHQMIELLTRFLIYCIYIYQHFRGCIGMYKIQFGQWVAYQQMRDSSHDLPYGRRFNEHWMEDTVCRVGFRILPNATTRVWPHANVHRKELLVDGKPFVGPHAQGRRLMRPSCANKCYQIRPGVRTNVILQGRCP